MYTTEKRDKINGHKMKLRVLAKIEVDLEISSPTKVKDRQIRKLPFWYNQLVFISCGFSADLLAV